MKRQPKGSSALQLAPSPPASLSNGRAWRGDLAVLLAREMSRADQLEAATLLGFEFAPKEEERHQKEDVSRPGGGALAGGEAPQPVFTGPIAGWAPIPFWQLESVEYFSNDGDDPEPDDRPDNTDRVPFARPVRTDKENRPKSPSLATWSSVGPRVWRRIGEFRPIRRIDVNAWVRAASSGEPVSELPRVHRQTWPASLVVIIDHADRLIPFWNDQEEVLAALQRWCGERAVRVELLTGRIDIWRPPPDIRQGMVVLALSDLGAYGCPSERAAWLRTGRRFKRAGVRLAALAPVPKQRLPTEIERLWSAAGWTRRPGLSDQRPQERAARAERVLAYLAPVWRLEPGLIRRALMALGAQYSDVGTEADVWNHSALVATTPVGAGWAKEDREEWFKRFRKVAHEPEAAAIMKMVAELHDDWLPPEVRYAEIFALLDLAESLVERGAADAARKFAELLLGSMNSQKDHDLVQPYTRRMVRGLPSSALNEDSKIKGRRARNALTRVAALAQAKDSDRKMGSRVDHRDLAAASGADEPRRFTLVQRGQDLLMIDDAAGITPGHSPVGFIYSRGLVARVGQTEVDPTQAVSTGRLAEMAPASIEGPKGQAKRPMWTKRVGTDAYGVYAVVSVGDVSFRMRRVDAGEFLMGSPDDEPGRWNYEGPVHKVTLIKGYWLAETPCTQALWTAVMGGNPSRFKSLDRPVEQVSWDDVQAFCVRLNERIPGLDIRLPTESEWEFACRAGTRSATYAGPIEISGDHHAPVLDAIAWYGGNSGVGFDLPDGEDNSGWPKKQHDDGPAGTHLVGMKAPNAWGFSDMLGNVDEWCQDWFSGYTADAAVDPGGPSEGTSRVSRGGAWSSDARYCRAAYRDRRLRCR